MEKFIIFLKNIKSLGLGILTFVNLILTINSFLSLPFSILPYSLLVVTISVFIIFIINEIFRKKNIFGVLINSLIIFSCLVLSFFILYNATNGKFDFNNLVFYIITIIVSVLLSSLEIIRSNNFSLDNFQKIKQDLKVTLAIIMFLFAGFLVLFSNIIPFISSLRFGYFYPITNSFKFCFIPYIVALTILLATRKKALSYSTFFIPTLFFFILYSLYQLTNQNIGYFSGSFLLISIPLVIANCLVLFGISFSKNTF